MSTDQQSVTCTRNSVGGMTGEGFQVILHNDNHNSVDYVIMCLMKIFGHGQTMAVKITMDAHNKGKSIAQVEEEKSAMKHCLSLRLCGLGADVEHI